MKLQELLAIDILNETSLEENTETGKAAKIIRSFIEFAANELQLNDLPKFYFFTDTDFSVKHSSFGGYGNGTIYVMVTNRHINDVLRSTAHEMVHYRQDIEGRIKNDSGDTGSAIENEANYMAGIIMREWGKMHPNLFCMKAIA